MKYDTKKCIEDLAKHYQISIVYVDDAFKVRLINIATKEIFTARDRCLDQALWRLVNFLLEHNPKFRNWCIETRDRETGHF